MRRAVNISSCLFQEKCAQYWPADNESLFYGDVQVNLMSESSINYYVLRVFEVRLVCDTYFATFALNDIILLLSIFLHIPFICSFASSQFYVTYLVHHW